MKRVTQSSSHLAAEDALFPAEELNEILSRAGGILISKLPLPLLGAFSAPLPPVPQKMLSALEPLLRSSESGGREEGAGSLGKESGFAHCGQITVVLSLCLCYLRPLRPEVYFVFENEPTSPSSYPIWVLSPFPSVFSAASPAQHGLAFLSGPETRHQRVGDCLASPPSSLRHFSRG